MVKGTQRKKLNDQFGIEDVGSSLLNELAEGLYTREAVLREYIQNAVDAHRLWERETGERPTEPIQVELRPNSISILDRGIGMNEQEARNVKAVAVSPKRTGQVSVELTGHKGVGIWAGLSFFESLTLRTSRKGHVKGYQIDLRFRRILEAIDEKTHIGNALNPNYEIFEFTEEIDAHYTDVTLTGPVKDREWFLDATEIGKAIRETCPCQVSPNFVFHDEVSNWLEQHGFDTFPITLNRSRMYREYSSAVELFSTETLTVDDKPVAEVWYATSKKKMLKPAKDELIGFRIVQTGFVIGSKNPYSAKTLQGFPGALQVGEYPDWYVGEIHVVMPDLYPNLPRNDFEETSESRRKLVQRIRKWYDERDVACRILRTYP